jgi:crotonobetainyl-CoA:carnitine CoA-transferase CaiB-like acyl-CoA transferase
LRIRQAPPIGEHNDYVLKDILGLPDEEITELTNDGVIG